MQEQHTIYIAEKFPLLSFDLVSNCTQSLGTGYHKDTQKVENALHTISKFYCEISTLNMHWSTLWKRAAAVSVRKELPKHFQ